jgi:adenylate kinase
LVKVRLVITGNPGVGKHTCTKLVAKEIDAAVVDVNQVAIKNDAVIKAGDVDVKKLKKLLAGELKKIKGNAVIVGHLAPYVLKSADVSAVVVLRRSPYLLADTFKSRGYTDDKARENMASETLGVSFFDALKTFGKRKTFEVDTTSKTPKQSAVEIIAALSDRSERKTGIVDWLSLVAEKGDIEKFFEYNGLKYP